MFGREKPELRLNSTEADVFMIMKTIEHERIMPLEKPYQLETKTCRHCLHNRQGYL